MTDPKVVGLRGRHVIDARVPNQNVINQAKRLLDMAESGEIQGLCYVILYADEGTGASQSGMSSYGMIGRLHAHINGILEIMK